VPRPAEERKKNSLGVWGTNKKRGTHGRRVGCGKNNVDWTRENPIFKAASQGRKGGTTSPTDLDSGGAPRTAKTQGAKGGLLFLSCWGRRDGGKAEKSSKQFRKLQTAFSRGREKEVDGYQCLEGWLKGSQNEERSADYPKRRARAGLSARRRPKGKSLAVNPEKSVRRRDRVKGRKNFYGARGQKKGEGQFVTKKISRSWWVRATRRGKRNAITATFAKRKGGGGLQGQRKKATTETLQCQYQGNPAKLKGV